jgi:transposase
MGQILHASATTTGVVRRAIQSSSDGLRALAKRYGINPKTVAKWKKRTSARGLAHGSAHPALDGARRRRRGGGRPRFAATERCRWTIAWTRFSRPSRI